MIRILRWAGIILATLVVVLALVVITLNLIPGEKYKSLISSGVRSATGRELAIDGDFDISLSTSLAFKASGIKFANVEWGSTPHMVSVARIDGELALFPLLRGILDFSLVVDEPDVNLETDDSGQGNWQFGAPGTDDTGTDETDETAGEAESDGGVALRPRIRKLLLNEPRFAFLDGKSGNQLEIESEGLNLGSETDAPAIQIEGKYNDTPLALTGELDLAKLVIENLPVRTQLSGHLGDINLKVQGKVGPLIPSLGLEALLSVNTNSMAAFSALTGQNLPDVGPLSIAANLTAQKDQFTLGDILAKLEDEILNVEIIGAIADLAAMEGLALKVKLDTNRLTSLLKVFGIPSRYALPATLNLTAAVEGSLSDLVLTDLQAKIQGQGLNINGTAQVENVITLAGISADVAVETESLDLLADLIQTELPSLGPLKLKANFTGKGKNMGAMEVKVDLKSEAIQADLTGAVNDPFHMKGVQAHLNLGVQSFDWLSEYLKTELPPLGSLSASGTIASKNETYEVQSLEAEWVHEGIQATLSGSIDDLSKFMGFNANIHVALDSLAALNSALKQELPASDPVSLESNITAMGGLRAPVEVAAIVKSDGFSANLSGSIAEPLAAKGIDLALLVEADSLEKLGKLVGAKFQGREPVKLESRFASRECGYELAGFHYTMGDLEIKGKAAFNPPSETGGRHKLSGELHMGDLNLVKDKAKTEPTAETQPETKGTVEKAEEIEENQKEKIFSSQPLALDPLKYMDADLWVTVESVTTRLIQLEDFAASLTLNDGLLNLKPMEARVGQGTFNGFVTLDARHTKPTLVADVELESATLRNFGGKLNSFVNVDGSGESIAAIMAGLNGHLSFDVREATLKKTFLTGFGAGLLNTLNPFQKDEEFTELACAIILFDIENGIAEANKTIAAQLTDVTWFGSGEINLKTEEIDFSVQPKSRKGLGISTGSLANLVALRGSLANPRIALDTMEAAKKYGKWSAALATGGVSVLADLFWSKIKSNTDVCAAILKELEVLEAEADDEVPVDDKAQIKQEHTTE